MHNIFTQLDRRTYIFIVILVENEFLSNIFA